MPLVLADRVLETTTSTGSGTITLAGAKSGYQSFSVIGNANTTYYTIAGVTQWEVGIGTYTSSGTTLSRDTVLASSSGGAKVTFSAGTKDVFVTYPAGRSVDSTSATITTLVSSSGTITNLLATSATISGVLLVRTTTNTNSSAIAASGTISEGVNGVQYLVASQFDIGTAPNQIPLNQYLGGMAYQDPDAVTIGDLAVTSATITTLASTSAVITTVSGTTVTYTSGTIGQLGATSANITTLTGTNFTATSLTLTNALGRAQGGTGVSTAPTNGQLLIGNGTGYALSTLTAGTGISVTNNAGSITIAASGGGLPTVIVTASTAISATANNHYILTATSTATVTLPASPTISDTIYVTNAGSLTTNVIARNGKPIQGISEDMTLNSLYASAQLRFTDNTRGWVLA